MLVCAQALLIAPILRLGRVLCICTSGVAKPISLVRESAKGTTAGLEEVSALVAHAGRDGAVKASFEVCLQASCGVAARRRARVSGSGESDPHVV